MEMTAANGRMHLIDIRVRTGCPRAEITGYEDGVLCMDIKSAPVLAPVEDKDNGDLIRYLSSIFKTKRDGVLQRKEERQLE
jgi:uncharacterized protein YggU (UPF0235/DUF167 family)